MTKAEREILDRGLKLRVLHLRVFPGIDTPQLRHDVSRDLKPLAKGGLTLAWIEDADETEGTIAYALCSKKDNYCRRTGRAIAVGRLLAHLDNTDRPLS